MYGIHYWLHEYWTLTSSSILIFFLKRIIYVVLVIQV